MKAVIQIVLKEYERNGLKDRYFKLGEYYIWEGTKIMKKGIKHTDGNGVGVEYVKATIELTNELGHVPTAQEVYNYLIKKKRIMPYRPIVQRKINK